MRFPILRLQTQHKFVRQLKKFLKELTTLPYDLSDDDVFDEKTKQAVIIFKSQWKSRVRSVNVIFDGEVTAGTWAMIGRALSKERLLQALSESGNEHELRSLLLGMDDVNRMYKGYYTAEMETCDAQIAMTFGGKNAVAAANGFDPDSFVVARFYSPKSSYMYYRGDRYNNGKPETGHLSTEAMHLYGSSDGTRYGVDGYTFTDLYIPDGFRGSKKVPFSFTRRPGPKQASLDFYYPQLGNYQDVTLMVSHIKNFKITKEGNRWRLGQIGGIGGNTPGEIHAHLDLFKGDVGMTGTRNRLSFAKAFCP